MPKKGKTKGNTRTKKQVTSQSEAWVEEKQIQEVQEQTQKQTQKPQQQQKIQSKDNFHNHEQLKKNKRSKSKQQKQEKIEDRQKSQKKTNKSKKKKQKKILTQQEKEKKKQIQNKKKINKMLSKKSIYEIDRINRSKYQKIFLLSADREQNIWKFKVQGSTGSHYHIEIANYLQCTCHDFRIHKKPCKHIYFLVTQVAQNDHLLGKIHSSTKINQTFFQELDKQLSQRLRSRMQPEKKEKVQIDLKDDKDCAICYCQMDKQTEDLESCEGCKKFFHLQCLNVWKSHNPSCPLCRRSFPVQPQNPLGKLQSVNL